MAQTLGLFDRILELEYRRHQNEWIADRRPIGFRWRPPATGIVAGGLARSRVSRIWMARTPAWAAQDEDALELFREYQRLANRRWPLFAACAAAVVVSGMILSVKAWLGA